MLACLLRWDGTNLLACLLAYNGQVGVLWTDSKLHQHRLISLLSHFAKTYRQILARRLRVILRAELRDTQALKHNEGCTYNTLILTQKVGERLEADCKTFCVFIDLQKAFDTVNKRLLWARLRCLGVKWKLLRALSCLLYTSPSPRDQRGARMPSSA